MARTNSPISPTSPMPVKRSRPRSTPLSTKVRDTRSGAAAGCWSGPSGWRRRASRGAPAAGEGRRGSRPRAGRGACRRPGDRSRPSRRGAARSRPPCTRRCPRACPRGSGRGGCRARVAPARVSTPGRRTSSSNVRFTSRSMASRRAPRLRAARGAGARRASPMPSASFRRCAGSTVRTTVRRPRRAAATASAAAVVVLPTPPLPTQRTTRRVSSSSAKGHAARRGVV